MAKHLRNKDLAAFYDRVYRRGERAHYTKLRHASSALSEEKRRILRSVKWRGKRVLDIGCGTGELAYHIARRGAAHVLGIDYSRAAIEVAKKKYTAPNLLYEVEQAARLRGRYDVILLIGVLEHFDRPYALLLQCRALLRNGGSLIVTCPNWSNTRGHVLIALRKLYGARITLADIHYFTPPVFEVWAKKLKLRLTWHTIEQSWGHGEKMITDFRRRLPNIAKETRPRMSDTRITRFIDWLESTITLESDSRASGAVGYYHFKKT